MVNSLASGTQRQIAEVGFVSFAPKGLFMHRHILGRFVMSGLAAFAAVLMMPTPAPADIIPELVSITPSGGGDFIWTYQADLTIDQKASNSGSTPSFGTTLRDDTSSIQDYFMIYDFDGLVAGSDILPSGWMFQSANVGSSPAAVNPSDNASIPNLTFVRTGSTLTGPLDLGLFSVRSIYNGAHLSYYAADATLYVPGDLADGTGASNIGRIAVPNGVIVPEPTGLAAILGGLAIGLKRFRR